MFKALLLDTSALDTELLKQVNTHVFQSFTEINIRCIAQNIDLNELTHFISDSPFQKDEFLLISNQSSILEEAQAQGMFCLGYCPNLQFLPTKYCIEDLEALDVAYLKLLWCRFRHLPYKIVTTRHLVIRELSGTDLKDLYNIFQEPEIKHFLPEEPDDLEDFIQKYSAYIKHEYTFYEYGMWGVFHKETDKLIGLCGFHAEEIEGTDEITVGYMLSKSYTKKGLGKEMVRAVVRYGIRHFDFSRIIAKISSDNTKSQNLIKACSFNYLRSITQNHISYELYEYIPKGKQIITSTKDASQRAFLDYQKHPDTSVYGKRYH